MHSRSRAPGAVAGRNGASTLDLIRAGRLEPRGPRVRRPPGPPRGARPPSEEKHPCPLGTWPCARFGALGDRAKHPSPARTWRHLHAHHHAGEGFLARQAPFPTLGCDCGSRPRGKGTASGRFTVINPRPEEQGLFDMELRAARGCAASDWARTCAPGDTIRPPCWQHPAVAAQARAAPRLCGVPSPSLNADFGGRTVIVGTRQVCRRSTRCSRTGVQDVEVRWLPQRAGRGPPLAAAPHHTVRGVRDGEGGSPWRMPCSRDWDAHRPTAQDRFWIAVEASENRRLAPLCAPLRGSAPTSTATAYWRNA
ncbi:hypothetical protein QJS66_01435 [Kocuria rhizophila]|nr:hypothetical protein QJS66_01435 [Kocuria rhizophila]